MLREWLKWISGTLSMICLLLATVFEYAPSDAGQAMPINGLGIIVFSTLGVLLGLICLGLEIL